MELIRHDTILIPESLHQFKGHSKAIEYIIKNGKSLPFSLYLPLPLLTLQLFHKKLLLQTPLLLGFPQ